MTKERLYRVSKFLHNLKQSNDRFWNTHAFRYAHFADNSPLGMDCRYAEATLLGYKNEKEYGSLRSTLLDMRAMIDLILGELDASTNS